MAKNTRPEPHAAAVRKAAQAFARLAEEFGPEVALPAIAMAALDLAEQAGLRQFAFGDDEHLLVLLPVANKDAGQALALELMGRHEQAEAPADHGPLH